MSSLKLLFGAAAPTPPTGSSPSTSASSAAVHKTRSPSMNTVEEDEEASAITLSLPDTPPQPGGSGSAKPDAAAKADGSTIPTSSPTKAKRSSSSKISSSRSGSSSSSSSSSSGGSGSGSDACRSGTANASVSSNNSSGRRDSNGTNSSSSSNKSGSDCASVADSVWNAAPFSGAKPASASTAEPASVPAAAASAGSTPSPAPSPTPVWSLTEILAELQPLMDAANNGEPFDENRLDYLLRRQEENPEYQEQIAQKLAAWKAEHDEFLTECLSVTRSFVPVTIFSDTMATLTSEEVGLPEEVAKRVLQKKCLWLVRMPPAEISRLHEADLYGRHNVTLLDIVELAAVYHVLPDRFLNDPVGKKVAWKEGVEASLRRMLNEKKAGTLPRGKCRAMCYENYCNGTNFRASSPMVRSGVSSPAPGASGNSGVGVGAAATPSSSSSVFSFSDGAAATAGGTAEGTDATATAAGNCSEQESAANAALSKRGSTALSFSAFNSATMDVIAPGRSRFGPVKDLTSVRDTEVSASSRGSLGPRRSFTEVCKTHGILGRKNSL